MYQIVDPTEKIYHSKSDLLAYVNIAKIDKTARYWKPEYDLAKWNRNGVPQFWALEWKDILANHVLWLADREYRGVCIDGLDGYESWRNCHSFTRPVESLMRESVRYIIRAVREHFPAFELYQNGSVELIGENGHYDKLLTGLMTRDVIYTPEGKPRPLDEIKTFLKRTSRMRLKRTPIIVREKHQFPTESFQFEMLAEKFVTVIVERELHVVDHNHRSGDHRSLYH